MTSPCVLCASHHRAAARVYVDLLRRHRCSRPRRRGASTRLALSRARRRPVPRAELGAPLARHRHPVTSPACVALLSPRHRPGPAASRTVPAVRHHGRPVKPPTHHREGLQPHGVETTQGRDHTGPRPHRAKTTQGQNHTGPHAQRAYMQRGGEEFFRLLQGGVPMDAYHPARLGSGH